jgi:molecular chaperone DnaK
LDNIPPAPRGVPQIEVTFDIDANGIISVSAKDKATGKEQKTRIEASSGLSAEEIERMKADAQANADADKHARERADVLNQADALLFQTEKQLGEFGDKIPADKRKAIEKEYAKLTQSLTAQPLGPEDSGLAIQLARQTIRADALEAECERLRDELAKAQQEITAVQNETVWTAMSRERL